MILITELLASHLPRLVCSNALYQFFLSNLLLMEEFSLHELFFVMHTFRKNFVFGFFRKTHVFMSFGAFQRDIFWYLQVRTSCRTGDSLTALGADNMATQRLAH